MICFPQFRKYVENFSPDHHKERISQHSFFHFIATDVNYEQKYLTSMNFNEILLCDRGAFVIPKAICVASTMPIFSL